MKVVIWTETDNWHNAFIGDKQVGCCYKSTENENRYYWVSGSHNGFTDTLVESMKKIEELNK